MARYDVAVIGAGITGAGVALDAATRGYSVLLIDKEDLAFGTSRWSSKLAHGGLRYLASGNVGIARRSAKERGILMEVTAPHLTRALPQVVPVMDRFSVANRLLPRVGFIAGDLLRMAAGTSGKTLPRSRTVSARKVAELCPAVDRDAVQFGYINYDGQIFDDAALVTALARTAAGYGANVLTHAPVVDVDTEGGVVTLELSGGGSAGAGGGSGGAQVKVQAGAVINATGVWAGTLSDKVSVRPSRGSHLVVDAAKLGNPTGALTVPVPGATNRFCFILPVQMGRVYIGITDEAAPEVVDDPQAPAEDIRFILDVVNQALAVELTEDDVQGAFAGLRPLVHFADAPSGATADLSREHAIFTEGKMVTVTGGKLTEYRLMAEQTLDAAIGARLLPAAGECRTATTVLVGGEEGVASPQKNKERLRHFGSEAGLVVEKCLLERPLEPVAEGVDALRCEFSFAVTHQGARTVEDILDRRTRVGLVAEQRAAAEECAREALEAAGVKPGPGA